MFSRLWNSLSIRAKSMKSKSSCRTALAACLALANREEIIKKGEESTFEQYSGYSKGTPTLHIGYRRKMEHFVEHCVSRYPGCHVPVLWRILIRSAHLNGNSQRCKALFYRAVRDCPTSKVFNILLSSISTLKDNRKNNAYYLSIFFYRISVWML